MTFDLAAEASRFVRVIDGDSVREASIPECLTRATELRLETSSKLEFIASTRLLCALVQDIFRPTRDEAALLAVKGFELKTVLSYLASHPLAVFTGNKPFYQVVGLKPRASWTQLDLARNSDNTRVIHDHTLAYDPPAIGLGEALMKLLVFQAFACHGGRGHGPGPLSGRLVCCASGPTLAATVCANLPFDDGTPIWRADLHTLRKMAARQDGSHLCAYTPLTRAVRLHKEGGKVRFIGYASGLKSAARSPDPMVVRQADGRPFQSARAHGLDRVANLVYGVDATPSAVLGGARWVAETVGGPFELVTVSCEADFSNPLRLRSFTLPLRDDPSRLARLREVSDGACTELDLRLHKWLDAEKVAALKRTLRTQITPVAEEFLADRQPFEVLKAAAFRVASDLASALARPREHALSFRHPTRLEVSFVRYLSECDEQALRFLTRPPTHPLFPDALLSSFTVKTASDRRSSCFRLLAHVYALNPAAGEARKTFPAACAATPEARRLFAMTLATSDLSDLVQVLPTAVRLVRGVPLEWASLLRDLCLWPDHRVKESWEEQFLQYEGMNENS